MNTPQPTSPPAWANGLLDEDLDTMHQLGALSTAGIVTEIKKLYDQTYQLGMNESKEMTRGKYLNIFTAEGEKTTAEGIDDASNKL